MSETTQLAKIKAPTIGEVNYAANMEKVFDNINENFKKIVSIPFLQGIKGDSFKLIEQKIFDDNKNLTDEGKVLLKSIYPDKCTENKNYKALGINSSDFIGDSAINSNDLLFYAIINDADEVEEKMLGQYYYFIDPEIKKLGEWYSKANATALSSFKDRSGFYMYDASTNLYTKTQFLPNLYYDSTKNDICWKFNEVETGISAIGIQGIPGENGTLQYVRVERIEGNKTSSKVNGVFNYNKTNDTFEWSNDLSDLSDGNALIFAEYKEKTNSSIINKIIFGKITKINNDFTAFWASDMIIDDRLRNDEIDAYFFNMRPGNNPVDAPKWLAIPSNADISSEEKNYGHVLYIDEPRKLNLQHSTNALDYTAADKPKPIDGNSILNIKNYTVKVGTGNNDLTLAPSKINLNQTIIDGTTGIKSNSGTISHIKSDNIESGAGTITTFESTKGTITNLKSENANVRYLTIGDNEKIGSIKIVKNNDVALKIQNNFGNNSNYTRGIIAVDPAQNFLNKTGNDTKGGYLDIIACADNFYKQDNSTPNTGIRLQNTDTSKQILMSPKLIVKNEKGEDLLSLDNEWARFSKPLTSYGDQMYFKADEFTFSGAVGIDGDLTIRKGLNVKGNIYKDGLHFIPDCVSFVRSGNNTVGEVHGPFVGQGDQSWWLKKRVNMLYINTLEPQRTIGLEFHPDYFDGGEIILILLTKSTALHLYVRSSWDSSSSPKVVDKIIEGAELCIVYLDSFNDKDRGRLVGYCAAFNSSN